MNLLELVDPSFAQRFTATLLHFLWQGALLGLFAFAAHAFLSRCTPRSRYALHLSVLLLMASCLPVTFLLINSPEADSPIVAESQPRDLSPGPKPRITPASLPPVEPASTRPIEPVVITLRPPKAHLESPKSVLAPAEIPAPPNSHPSISLSTLVQQSARHVTLFYFAGLVLFLVRLLRAIRGGHLLQARSTIVSDESLLSRLQQLVRQIGLRRQPLLAWCAEISAPIVVGIVRPMILLPAAAATRLSPDQLHSILLHELTHISRYDLPVNLAQRLIESLLFFHPAVWFVSRRISTERELACDAQVVSAGCDPVRYADALLQMAQLSLTIRGINSPLTSLAAAGSRPTEFKRRVLKILGIHDASTIRPGRTAWSLFAACTILAILVPIAWSRFTRDSNEKTAASRSDELTPPPKFSPWNEPVIVRGIDLESFPSTDDPSLVAGLLLPRSVITARPDVLTIPLHRESNPNPFDPCVYFKPSKSQFFVRTRGFVSNRDFIYGPIEGDPFTFFNLDDEFRENLWHSRLDTNELSFAAQMLQSGDQTLLGHAVELMDRSLNCQDKERRKINGVLVELLVESRKKQLGTRADDLLKQARESSGSVLMMPMQDWRYRRVTEFDMDSTRTIAESAWGEPVCGLRAALLLDSPQLDQFSRLGARIVVENISDRTLRFAYLKAREIERFRMFSEAKAEFQWNLRTSSSDPANSPADLNHVVLEPSQRAVLDQHARHFIRVQRRGVPDSSHNNSSNDQLTVKEGRYAVAGQVHLGPAVFTVDDLNRRVVHSPLSGEQFSCLQTGLNWTVLSPASSMAFGNNQTIESLVENIEKATAAISNLSVTTDFVETRASSPGLPDPIEFKYETKAVIDRNGNIYTDSVGQNFNLHARDFDVMSEWLTKGRWVTAYRHVDNSGRRVGKELSLNWHEGNFSSASLRDNPNWKGIDPREFTTHFQREPVAHILRNQRADNVEQADWDGRPVLVVETNLVVDHEQRRYRLWIDPKLAVVVRRQALVKFSVDLPWQEYSRIECHDYREIAPGVWLPMQVHAWSLEASRDLASVKPGRRFVATNRDWTLNRVLPENTFDLEIPSGVIVQDHRLHPENFEFADKSHETTIRGYMTQREIEQSRPVWGTPKQGIQWGLAVDAPQLKFRPGNRVPLIGFVRNVSDKTLTVETSPGLSVVGPTLFDLQGKEVGFEAKIFVSHSVVSREALQPGDAIGFRFLSPALGPNPKSTNPDWIPRWVQPSPGHYTIQHTQSIRVHPAEGIGNQEFQPYQSGPVQIEVIGESFWFTKGNEEFAVQVPVPPEKLIVVHLPASPSQPEPRLLIVGGKLRQEATKFKWHNGPYSLELRAEADGISGELGDKDVHCKNLIIRTYPFDYVADDESASEQAGLTDNQSEKPPRTSEH